MELNEKVQELITKGYEFKFNQYLTEGYNYFKAQAGHFIGFFVLSIIMIIVVSFIPIIGSLGSQVLSITFLVGYFVVARNIKIGNNVSFDDFFKGFSSIGQLTIIQLIIFGFTLLLISPLLIYGFGILFSGLLSSFANDGLNQSLSAEDILGLFNLEGIIPMFIITILLLIFMQTIYSFAAVNAHFFKTQAWPSMEASRKVIQKKFFHFLGLILVIALLNILGTICLFVGLLVTVPMSYTILYAAFDDIMQPDGDNKILDEDIFERRNN